ncbi:hypothetical protein Bca52824_049474 [Brassica carinata]|uniref:Uncharacterized protein n=1 Tax=Brassica carinata TaxID=52824 RepID=A0A8X7RN95_BRACI|nr:hypothetical protein Bca52824_049474 [Brassica carinata]
MSTSNPTPIDSQFAISTFPRSKSRSCSSKIDSLYEIEYVPGDQLPETTLPLVNPYEYFAKKPSAFSVMEYVQSSKFSSCQVPATEEEQFISLNILENLPRLWQQQGYTHLHFSVVRIGLTLHARKGLPVIARIALIDSRLKSYQQACIGTTLKVQLQLIGAPMQEKSVAATLNHQIVYRIQDHALDLVLPSSDEALYLEVTYASQAPNSIQIPRQISRKELLRRLPESWATSYEKLHQATQSPIQSSEVSFHSRKTRSSSFRRQLFTQFAIQIDEQSFHGPAKEQNPKPSYFEKDGTVIYPFKDKDGHCYFDVCSCTACDEASYESDEDIRIRRRKKKDPLYQRYLEGVTSVGPPGEGKYDFIVQYSDKKEEPRQLIMMINPDEFPPQEEFLRNNIAHCPKILSQAVDSSGPSQLSQAEKVLNWQTENSLAQNQLLSTINHKVDQLAEGYNSRLLSLQNSIAEIHGRLGNLHQEMMTVAKHMMANTTQFRNKEAETTSLKSQLRDLQRCIESMIHNQQ